ncbi:MAG: glycosyltransferase family 4 protein [Steroidobacteraceae bacterium]
MKTLIVEGWRTSCHSYALVNQHQLLYLLDDPRFCLYHRDVLFARPHWAGIDSGLPEGDKARLAAIAPPAPGVREDVIYRISFPFRVYPGAGRVFVFATSELIRTLPLDCVGADGRRDSAQPGTVDIVTPSAWSRRGFLQAGYSPDRVHLVPHGIDPAVAAPFPPAQRRQFRDTLGLRDEEFAFLNISAMTWNKGIGPLIAAFAVHRRAHPASVLLLKGGDALYGNVIQSSIDEARRLRPEARDPTLFDSIRYIPQNLSRDEVTRLYRATDAYISPYRAEGFNLPVLEAMAAGLPVIVTRGGATDDFCLERTGLKIAADFVSDDEREYLEPRVDSIIEQMSRMVEDASLRERLALAGRESAVQRFSWKHAADSLAQVLLGAPARSAVMPR